MSTLGKYQLVAEIARGGMGIVYLAIAHGPARFSKLLVVKELKPELVDDPTFLEMFLEEARLAARLNHPNIVQTYEIGNEGKRHYIVMDYLEGVTLARVIREKSTTFTLPMHLRVICETLSGLHYAHTLTEFDGTPMSVVHRDATPQNVFVTFDGQIKLVDFGIAKALDSTVETRTGVLKGKPAYMPPEQLAGEVDPRTDVFSVGVMLWEAVAKRRMWQKKTDVEILTHIIKGEIPSLKDAVPDAPPALVRMCDLALAKSRSDRYPSAADFQADLEAYLVSTKSNVSPRDVSKTVGEIFKAERTATRGTIDQHLNSLKAAAGTGTTNSRPVPSLPPPPIDATPSDRQLPAGPPSNPMSPLPPASNPSFPTNAGTPPGAAFPSASSALAAEAAKGSKQKTMLAAGAAAVVLVAIGVGVGLSSRSKPPTPAGLTPVSSSTEPDSAQAPTLSRTPDPPSTGATAASHEISVRIVPPSATITFDGAVMSNPVKRSCQHGQKFILRAQAAGHAPLERELKCDRDESLELVLTQQPVAWTPAPPPPPAATGRKTPAASATAHTTAPVATAAPPTATPPSQPAGAVTAGGTKPNRPIETASPYGNQ